MNFDQKNKDCIHLWNIKIENNSDLCVMSLNDKRQTNFFRSDYNNKIKELHNEIYKS